MLLDLSGIFLAEAAALVVLLLSSLLVYRAFPQRYLLLWSGGWLLYLAHMSVGLRSEQAGGLFSMGLLLAAQAGMAGAVGVAATRRAPFRWLLPVGGVTLLAEVMVRATMPAARGWPIRAGYLALGLMGAVWILQYGSRRPGWGPWLLAAGLLLRLVHFPDLTGHRMVGLDGLEASGGALEAVSSVIVMVAMLVLALEAMRQHLRWSVAPGAIASLAASYTAPGRLGREAFERIAEEVQRVFEASFSRFYLLPPGETPADAEFLLALLPRSAAGQPPCISVLGPEKGPEAAAWLRERGLRWAVIVPVPHSRLAVRPTAGLFVLGYRRRWISPELMEALMGTGRQFGILLENSLLLQQLSHAYRDWLNTVDAIGDLILVHDAEYRIQRVNRALAERVGAAPVDIIHRFCRDVLPRGPRSSWKECPFCESPHDGDIYDEDFRGYFLSATYRYPREEASEIQHVVKDITDRKRAEEKYRTIFEKVHEGVFVSSRAGRFLDFNDALARMLGYEREELMALDIRSTYVAQEDRDRYLDLMEAQGYVRDYEVRLRRKNGEVMIGLETSFGTRDESGKLAQFQGFMLDITARKKAEEQLHEHAGKLSAINELAERLTESLDAQPLIQIVVRELRRIFRPDTVGGYLIDAQTRAATRVAAEGYATAVSQETPSLQLSEEFVAALQADRRAVIPLADLPALPAEAVAVQQAESQRSVFVVPLRGEQIVGGITLAWRELRVLSPAEENLLGAVGRQLNAALENARLYQQTRQAYEELRRTQEQLLQSEKMAALGQLISGVAHELNNPLTAIIGYSQLLASEVTPRGGEYVNKLLRQARRTQKIIQNLLSFSRQRKPERRLVDLNRVIEETLMLREFDMRAGNVRVERQLRPDLPPVHADVHQLEQVFLNIINNACDAFRESGVGGILGVHTYLEGQTVVAEFRDDGPGMKEPARVFDPFYTTKTVGQGTGLGLSICYGIIKEHGGEITAENNADRGAAFRVRLPAARIGAATAVSN